MLMRLLTLSIQQKFMQIISHRGYWKNKDEQNTGLAFERSFSLGIGTETDLRDSMGSLVVSHDLPRENCIGVHDFFSIYAALTDSSLTLALNIKADGLQEALRKALAEFKIHNYFVFDMSIPDTLGYVKHGIRFFSRQSEYESDPVLYTSCSGIWLDAFHNIWYTGSLIKQHLDNKKQVAIVSPELHKREHLSLWQQLKNDGLHNVDDVILCTDFPEEALAFFNDKK
jgi:hypothetical protein